MRRGRIGQLLKQPNSALYIRCTGILSQIMDETSEELIIEEKGQNSRFEQQNSDLLKAPKIQQDRNLNYQIGDQLQLNCSSDGYHSLPAPYLEWFVNNRRINEQYVHNYATVHLSDHLQQQTVSSFVPINGEQSNDFRSSKLNKIKNIGHLITNSDLQMPESDFHSLSKSFKSTHSSVNGRTVYKKTIRKPDHQRSSSDQMIDKNDKNFQNDYLFSNNLKKLNLLSFQTRNKNNNLTNSSNNLLDSLSFLNQTNSSFVNSFHQQTLYNNSPNLTRLQNIIYQHYADYSFKPAQHRIGIRFRVMKKHYQVKK